MTIFSLHILFGNVASLAIPTRFAGAKKKTTTTTKKTKTGTNIKDSSLFFSFIVYRSSLGHLNSHKRGAQRQQDIISSLHLLYRVSY